VAGAATGSRRQEVLDVSAEEIVLYTLNTEVTTPT